MERSRFTIFVRALEGGGAQRDSILLANGLARLGMEVTIISLKTDGGLRPLVCDGVRIVKIPAQKLRSAVRALRRTIKSVRSDFLLSSEAAQNVVTSIAVSSLRARERPHLVLREVASPSAARQLDPYIQNRLAYRCLGWFYRRADHVLTLTDGARDDLIRNFGVPSERVSVIGSNAVIDDITYQRLASWDGETGREKGLIVCIGRLSHEKGQLTLVEAMARLPGDLDCRVVIAGDGPLREALEERIHTLGLCGRVTLIGQVYDPFAWIMRAELVINCSLYEGFGNVLVESLACGTPVIATDCPFGPREILMHSKYGTLFPIGDASALAYAITQTLGQPVDRRALQRRAEGHTHVRAASALIEICRLSAKNAAIRTIRQA